RPVENPVWIEKVVSVTGDSGGIFYPQVDRGSYVSRGTKLGYITDFYGKTVQEARAPEAGVVLYINAVPTMTNGGTVANIGTIAASNFFVRRRSLLRHAFQSLSDFVQFES